MTIENIRVPAADNERDPVLKDMSERGWVLVAVTEDRSSVASKYGTTHYWSLYFTRTIEEK